MLNLITPRATERMTKALSTGLLVLASATAALAQGGINAAKDGINNATRDLTSIFDPATLLIYVIAAIVGLYGGFKVFSKWQAGDQDTQKAAMGWLGGCIFLVSIAAILRAFFL
jgi:hypothetical protein